VGLSPLGTPATIWPIVLTPDEDDDKLGEFGVIGIGKENQNTRRILAPAPLCPPQIPYS
jgi:hypothetical protein